MACVFIIDLNSFF